MDIEIKDFQKATAERILYLYKDMGRRRVLLSDEVGLGKTFVAKNVIDLVREWHRSELHDDFFKVVYICSNANIADQNISKLGVRNDLGKMSISESRLSMQHLYITIANRKIAGNTDGMPESIIPLTPTTSFKFYSALGTANERALIFDIVKEMPEFQSEAECLSRFLSGGVKNWDELCLIYMKKIQEECDDTYIGNMIQRLRDRLPKDTIDRLLSFAKEGRRDKEKSEVINTLRRTFAEISIDLLDPDLVIMDEFQRFSDLLQQNDDERSMLARRFFDTHRTNTKVLLLSATPYKPYSTLEELNIEGRDEHYQDFMRVMDFLFVSKNSSARFKNIWQHYSAALKRTDVKDLDPLIEAKNNAENELFNVMCRTERFNNGIIDDSNVTDIAVLPNDILAYAQSQNMVERIVEVEPNLHVGNMPMEYVKASPYLLSFMDRYELKKKIVRGLRSASTLDKCDKDTLLLSKYQVNNYRKIEPSHGKLKFLHDLIFGERCEKKSHLLLWVPTSHPYYKAEGLFESEEAKRFSKVILFSAWEMVPRMVSMMISYYSELYTIGEIKKSRGDIRYTTKNRYGENRLKTEGILEYPCMALSQLYAPQAYYGWKLSAIRKDIHAKIKKLIEWNEKISALPKQGRNNAQNILKIMKLLDGKDIDETDLYLPGNIIEVMTDIAISSPAVCAYRQSGNPDNAVAAAKAIVSIFNKSEAAAIIDLLYNKKNEDDYYISVLDYCAKGNLQAVLDEYAHILGKECIGTEIDEAVIGTSTLLVDTKDSIENEEKKMAMRCHFAIPFIDKTVTDKSVSRTANIRKAFNSPFRPFVLSTTSIGQEGLDFHAYSRKIVHWNLPSNAVNLEQREGRINRYKCLAIRRNVAHLYCSSEYMSWDELFDIARQALKGTFSDIVPYWCLPVENLTESQKANLEYIERIVPLYPFSRDKVKYERLIKVLSLYRMTLGQPRQEELLNLLKEMKLSDEQLHKLIINLCPYDKMDTEHCVS
jgi:hypothetical protein